MPVRDRRGVASPRSTSTETIDSNCPTLTSPGGSAPSHSEAL
jgi:hypothetical protein